MRPRDRPSGKTGSMGDPPEEPIVIDMFMDGPEEAGAKARSPSPKYENPEVAEVLMDKAERRKIRTRARARNTRCQDPGAQAEVPGRGAYYAYYTQNCRPRQDNGSPTVRGKPGKGNIFTNG